MGRGLTLAQIKNNRNCWAPADVKLHGPSVIINLPLIASVRLHDEPMRAPDRQHHCNLLHLFSSLSAAKPRRTEMTGVSVLPLFFAFARSSTWAGTSTVCFYFRNHVFFTFSNTFPLCILPKSRRVRRDLVTCWVLRILKERPLTKPFNEKCGLLCIQVNVHPAKRRNITSNERQIYLLYFLKHELSVKTKPINCVPHHDYWHEDNWQIL